MAAGELAAVAWGEPVTFTTSAPTIQLALGHGPEPAVTGQTVYFTATAATNGTGLAYQWDFGQGAAGGGLTASHAFDLAGSHLVTVTATDACSYTRRL